MFSLKLLSEVKQLYKQDGLSELSKTQCRIVSVLDKKLYTHIFVDIGDKMTTIENYLTEPVPNLMESQQPLITPRKNIWLQLKIQ